MRKKGYANVVPNDQVFVLLKYGHTVLLKGGHTDTISNV